ncbi:hypothetical protein BDV06DRAFT_232810 [Aspergillus oleicola]
MGDSVVRISPRHSAKRLCFPAPSRYFHRITTDFVHQNETGELVSRKVGCVIGNPGESYLLIEPEVGSALRAACLTAPGSAASAPATKDQQNCQLTFFHESLHFGFESLDYPRLYVPSQLPRQTKLDKSPATLFFNRAMDEIVLDGTGDANFAEMAHDTGRDLGPALDALKNM